MIDERRVFVVRFRNLAEEFSKNPDDLKKFRLSKEAGDLLMTAYDRGYLILPGLGELVDWVRTPSTLSEVTSGNWASGHPLRHIHKHPTGLFYEVAGYNAWRIAPNAEGHLELTGEADGGILPRLVHESPALQRPEKGQPLKERYETKLALYSTTCALLADAIERWNPREARDAWVYEQARLGRTWQWILNNMPDWCPDREQLTTVPGIKKCAIRYATNNNLPQPEKRRGGAPRKN